MLFTINEGMESMKQLLLLIVASIFFLGACIEENMEDDQLEIEQDKSEVFQLPRYVPVSNGKYLTSTAVMDRNITTIMYYESDKKLALNDPAILSDAQPIARLQIEKFQTKEEANEQIAFENYKEYGGQEVDLGFDVTGYQEATAKSFWTNWNEDRWAITTHTEVINRETSLAVAKEIVEFLQVSSLPTPISHGRIYLDFYTESSRIVWQNGLEVYTLDEVSEPMDLLKIVSSIPNR